MRVRASGERGERQRDDDLLHRESRSPAQAREGTGGITTLGHEGEEVSPSAALPHFFTCCRAPLHRASEPLCAALL